MLVSHHRDFIHGEWICAASPILELSGEREAYNLTGEDNDERDAIKALS
jgi:hypothetical protein